MLNGNFLFDLHKTHFSIFFNIYWCSEESPLIHWTSISFIALALVIRASNHRIYSFVELAKYISGDYILIYV